MRSIAPLACGDVLERRDHSRVLLHQLVALVVVAERVAVARRVILAKGPPGVKRERLVCLAGLERVDHLLLVELEVDGDLVDGRRAAVLSR